MLIVYLPVSYATERFLTVFDVSSAVASFKDQSEFKEKESNVLMVDTIQFLKDRNYYRFSNYK